MNSQKQAAALVTGGARGIGRAISIELASRGLPVFVNYQSNKDSALEVTRTIEDAGGTATAIEFDVRDPESVRETVRTIKKSGYWVSVLVNNAGITRDNLMAMMSIQDWTEVLDTNLTGAFHCSQACMPGMIANRSGRIINLASVSGLHGQAGQSNYGASKAGLVALTRSLARELGGYGILVNAVAQGFIDTDLLSNLKERPSGASAVQFATDHMIPLGRTGQAKEVASIVGFLASESASYLSGQVVAVDGGMSA